MSTTTLDYVRDMYTGEDIAQGGDASTNPLLFGDTTAPWASVPIYENGVLIFMAYANAAGNWEITFPVDDGHHAFAFGSPDATAFKLTSSRIR